MLTGPAGIGKTRLALAFGQAVIPFGFRFTARNLHCIAGPTGFSWLAVGWLQERCVEERK